LDRSDNIADCRFPIADLKIAPPGSTVRRRVEKKPVQAKTFSTINAPELMTSEGCYIQELSNSNEDGDVSIARARVQPGVTTFLHLLRNTGERYLILQGQGAVEIGAKFRAEVSPGDVVWIPQNAAQRITNTGTDDLVFLCICAPRFERQCYESLEERS
jgi:mannose-6-phosphate isomerase-like protein (cupin superfamily)